MLSDQQCVGALILAVQNKLLNPSKVFGKIKKFSYTNIDPEKWYPMEQFTALTDVVEQSFDAAVLQNIGRQIVPEMKKANILPPEMSPSEFIKSLEQVYEAANKGTNIGEWKVAKEEPHRIIMHNSTMHNCILEEGVVWGGLAAYGTKVVTIKHPQCKRKGATHCIFDIAWA